MRVSLLDGEIIFHQGSDKKGTTSTSLAREGLVVSMEHSWLSADPKTPSVWKDSRFMGSDSKSGELISDQPGETERWPAWKLKSEETRVQPVQMPKLVPSGEYHFGGFLL